MPFEKELKVFLGSDHAGFETKEKIKNHLQKLKVNYEDLGPSKYAPGDDYPDYAFKVAQKVSQNKDYRGILICGTGLGMQIAANKVKGIRAASPYDAYSAKMSRAHNNTNILGLRGRSFPFSKIKQIITIWLKTPFSEEERHKHRIAKISNYENKK
ncbi:MAG: ribose 5-phosphate isomerase B [Nanoarchaeota archaeon]|nr:ribose 5-phosphate isomerase B [Nanoarchaeota archaeon]